MRAASYTRQSGFTLLELAVVMMCVGLIMGGLLVAQGMIRTSKVNAILGEFSRYTAAVTDFRDKYQSLPGDMATAENFWGSDTACPATPYTATPHTATCNGDGNGHIDGTTEPFRAWQQLADAGFITGNYTGVMGAGGANHHVFGGNAPASVLDGGGFDLFYAGNKSADANYYDGYYPLRLGLGGMSATSFFYNSLFAPDEALMLDLKVDDGSPAMGNLRTYKSPLNPGCTTADTSAATYNTATKSFACALIMIIPDSVK